MVIAQCIHDFSMSYGLPISLLMAGLVGGFTHCAGMCSPFVLALSGNQTTLKKTTGFLLLPYHFGRMVTYITMAVLANTILNLAFVFSDLKSFIAAPVLMLAGTIFLVSAFPKLGILFPWALNIQISTPFKFASKLIPRLTESPRVLAQFGMGVLLGLMPCGLVVSALMASTTAPDTFHAAIAMSAFTLGTMPALILIAFCGQGIKQKYPRTTQRLSQAALTLSGLWLFTLAGTLVL